MRYTYKISNRGTSGIKNLLIRIFIPIVYSHDMKKYDIAKLKDISCLYKGQSYDVRMPTKEEAEESSLDEVNDRVKRSLVKKQVVSTAEMLKGDELDDSYKDRTIFINCKESSVECLEANVMVQNVENSKHKIYIDINFVMNIQEIGKNFL